MVTIHSLKTQKPFHERTRVYNMQLRVSDLRKEIDLLESNSRKARTLGSTLNPTYVHEADNLAKKLPRLKEELKTAEHHLDVAATEEAKRQHDEMTQVERDQELAEFYAHEEAERQKRFEAWRKARRT